MAQTLYDKLWDSHVVHVEEDGTALLYIDRHLVHEVTSPQAFEGLKLAGRLGEAIGFDDLYRTAMRLLAKGAEPRSTARPARRRA